MPAARRANSHVNRRIRRRRSPVGTLLILGLAAYGALTLCLQAWGLAATLWTKQTAVRAAAVPGPSAAPLSPVPPPSPRSAAHPPVADAVLPPPEGVTPLPPVEIDRGSGARPEVALTFDAGADWRPAIRILDTLAEAGVRSTFFLTGEWVRENPRTTRRIVQAGHEVGNHSWNHPDFTRLSDEQIRSQLRRTEAVVRETAAVTTRPYFRPPFGARDHRVRQVAGSEGFLTLYWTLDSRDAVDPGITARQIRDRIVAEARPGSIILLHCGSQATAEALPDVLAGLRERGLTAVALSRLLEQ